MRKSEIDKSTDDQLKISKGDIISCSTGTIPLAAKL